MLAACAPAATPAPTLPVIISIHASALTQSWLPKAYDCAQKFQLILSDVNDPAQADISIRIGEPVPPESSAYQIGQDDVLILTNPENPLQNLTLEQVRAVFSDPGKQSVQVWVFAPGEDLQQVFSREVMQDTAITSLANLALSPQQMLDALNKDKNAIGLLPRHLKNETLHEIFNIPAVPVLALTTSEPKDAVKKLLGCLQH